MSAEDVSRPCAKVAKNCSFLSLLSCCRFPLRTSRPLREAQAFSSRPLATLAQAAKIAKNGLNSWGSNIFFSLPIYAVLSALCVFARECFFSFLSLITPYCLTSLRDILVPLCLHLPTRHDKEPIECCFTGIRTPTGSNLRPSRAQSPSNIGANVQYTRSSRSGIRTTRDGETAARGEVVRNTVESSGE
jgi:hypothetical protein